MIARLPGAGARSLKRRLIAVMHAPAEVEQTELDAGGLDKRTIDDLAGLTIDGLADQTLDSLGWHSEGGGK
jgi:hypothetical protein